MIESYLGILEESLQKKTKVLDNIIKYNSEQEQLLKQEKVQIEDIDTNMDRKDELIQKMKELDEGFESLYERVKEQLLANKDAYKEQIRRIQELISQITEKSVSIQAQESRNKKLIEQYFTRERKQLGQERKVSKAAYDYYKNMSNINVISPQILDQKK